MPPYVKISAKACRVSTVSALLLFGKQTSLPGITDFQFVVDMVEDAAFFKLQSGAISRSLG